MNPKDLEKDLLQLAAGLRQHVEAGEEGLDPSPQAIAQRVKKVQNNFAFFVQTYFPKYTQNKPAQLHEYLYKALPAAIDGKQAAHLAIAAPRGNAKSTLVALMFVLWCLVTGRKKYIVLIMAAHRQATAQLSDLKKELTENPRLLLDFPEHTGEGRTWQDGAIVTQGNAKVEAKGANARMRGMRHGAHRPDLVILDDLENDQNVQNPQQRDKLEDWLNKAVLSLGGANGSMDTVIIGTVLHYDSVLSRFLNNPLWQAKVFKSIIRWPDNMDLWDNWQDILLNEGELPAKAFWREHKAAMLQGAVIGWPDALPLIHLMLKRATHGQAAFDSEQQNDPIQGDNAPFANCITYYNGDNPRWVYFGACDPSLGKKGNGRDPSALLIGGFDRQSGILDVVHASIKKRLPDTIIEDIIALQKQFKCAAWAIEAVQFQEFLRTELIKRGSAQGVPIPARAVIPNADKRLRIESLQPHMANGLIRLNQNQQTLIRQLKHYPAADHDDGPDCLHMLWQQASSFATYDGARLATRDGSTLVGKTAARFYGDFEPW